MDLKHIVSQQRRRKLGPSLEINFEIDKSNRSRVGPTPSFSRASSGTFVNKNGFIVGKTTSSTSLNLALYKIGDVVTIDVPNGSLIGWIVGSRVFIMQDTNRDDNPFVVDQNGSSTSTADGHFIDATILSYTATTLTVLIAQKSGNTIVSSWFVSYRGLRIDHDPITGACKGYLIEGPRTNYVGLSTSSPIGLWPVSNGTPIASVNSSVNPDGVTRNNVILSPTGDSNASYNPSGGGTTVAAGTYTVSVYVKYVNARWIRLTFLSNSNDNRVNAWFDVQNGVTGTISLGGGTLTNFSHDIVPSSNGWYRLSITATTTAVASIGMYIIASSADNTTDRGSNMEYGLWGAQAENGPFTSSLIPTVGGSSAIRSSDLSSITGANFNRFYNQIEGTLFANISVMLNSALGGNRSFVAISDGSYSNFYTFQRNSLSTNIAAAGNTGGPGSQAFSFSTPYTRFTRTKIALGLKTNDVNAAFNGSLKTLDTNAPLPTVTKLDFLDPTGASGGHPFGHIAFIRYYPRRLSDSQLQTLTTTVTEQLFLDGDPIVFINTNNTVTITI